MTKTILLTGGNRGLGRATVEKLCAAGHAVTFTARDVKKGEEVAAEIRAKQPGAKVDCLPLDVLDRGSIRALAETIAARPEPLDVLVNNAGLLVSSNEVKRTSDGVEVTFATNVLGPFLMKTLMPLMPFAHSIDEATNTFVMAATDPSLEGTTGRFFGESKPIVSSPESYDEAKAKRLWGLCLEMLGVDDWP